MGLESERNVDATICLRFVQHPGIFTTLVRYAQFGFPQTHCEALLPDRKGAIGAWFDGGTQVRQVGYDSDQFSHELLFNLEVTAQQQSAFYSFLSRNLGAPYDALAIVAFAAGRDWQSPDSWFCSEYIAAGMVDAGLFPSLFAARLNKITVKDLALICAGLRHG